MSDWFACGGSDMWPMFYIGLVIVVYFLALGLSRWKTAVHADVDVGLTVILFLLLEWWCFNLLQSTCTWNAASNIAVEFLLGWYANRRWRRSGRAEPLGLLLVLIVVRIFWHAAWGVGVVGDYNYAWGLNATFIIQVLIAWIAVMISVKNLPWSIGGR